MNFLDKCSILTGTATLNNEIFITVMNDGLAEERQQHAIPLSFKNDTWSLIYDEPVFPWIVAGIDSIKYKSLSIVIVGWGGQVLVVDGDICHREYIQRKDSGYVSIVRSITTIDDAVYVVGMNRQVHKRTIKNGWEAIDHDVVYQGDEITVGFNAIGGFDVTEVYASGMNGEIWNYDNNRWNEIQSLTNVHLHSLCCASDGYVYIVGKDGILIRGRHESWEVLDTDFEETIWDVHYFRGELYLITNDGVYIYTDGVIEKIQNDLLNYGGFLKISSSKDNLWIFGGKKIVQFDGLSWRECKCILSDEISNTEVFGFFNDDVLVSGSDYLED